MTYQPPNSPKYNPPTTKKKNEEFLKDLDNKISCIIDTIKSYIYGKTHELRSVFKDGKLEFIALQKKISTFDDKMKVNSYNILLRDITNIQNFFLEGEFFEYSPNILNLDSESIKKLKELINSIESINLSGNIFDRDHILKINDIIKLSKELPQIIEKYKSENHISVLENKLWKNLYIYNWDNLVIKLGLSEFKHELARLDLKYNRDYKSRLEYIDVVDVVDKIINGYFPYKNSDDKDAILEREHFRIYGM